ncbi:MAG: tetratricopeptide repeat protein [Thermoanaerobaculia bacterium]
MSPARAHRLITLGLAITLAIAGAAAAAGSKGTDAQLDFGIKMAKRGLWNEALFRFSRVLKERPGDPRVLNNMAVAYEAIGQFDKALEHYKLALERDSANRELRRNYAQFVEFYQGLKPQAEDEAATEREEAAKPEPEESANGGAAP